MAEQMKAQVFYEPLKMELQERALPQVAPDEVLVRVRSCGVCGSDIAYYWGLSPLETADGKGPLVLGHEFAGEVARVGDIPSRLGLFSEGQRVVVNPVQHCNACEVCNRGYVNLCENKQVLGVGSDGGFADYVRSAYAHVHALPDNVSFEHGALTEPLACATYAIENLQVGPGDLCVVIGPGPIGLMMVQLARSAGAGVVALAGTRDYRLELGRSLGADLIFNTAEPTSPHYTPHLREEIAARTSGRMADRVITSTGDVSAMETALAISGRRSVVVFFGLPGAADRVQVPALDSILWDKTIRFSWLAPHTWPTALRALSTGLVNVAPLVTHQFSLDSLTDSLQFVRDRRDNVMKAVITP